MAATSPRIPESTEQGTGECKSFGGELVEGEFPGVPDQAARGVRVARIGVGAQLGQHMDDVVG